MSMTTPKIILVPFMGSDNELGALEVAGELARKWNAHIAVWHISPDLSNEAFLAYADMGWAAGAISGPLIRDMEKRAAKTLNTARKKYYRTIRLMGIPEIDSLSLPEGASTSFHYDTGRSDRILKSQARIADLVVISRDYKEDFFTATDIVEAALFGSGKPVLLVPPGKHRWPMNGKTMIAWNGSAEAASAVSFALPLLTTGKVWIAAKTEEAKFPLSTQDLATYLGYHGISAKTIPAIKGTQKTGPSLLQMARKADANLIVMGAYTHSRMRESILGGVTDHMLHKANLPILMAH